MTKTWTAHLIKTKHIDEKIGKARSKAGTYKGFEYRLISDDPEFNQSGEYCEDCKELHRSPIEGRWILPDRPIKIGQSWAKAHHFRSLIEVRPIIFEKKIGKKTISTQTRPDIDSFTPQGTWRTYAIITKEGSVNYIGSKELPSKKIAASEPEMPTSFEKGITIYTTDVSDPVVHELIANALSCSPASLINSHYKSSNSHYNYQRPLSIRYDKKTLKWTAMGGRIKSPKTLIASIQNRFPGAEHVRIDVVDNVDLA